MARYNSKDYIPTYGDLEARRDECRKNAQEAKDRGFRLGEYELSYNVLGRSYTEKMSAVSEKEAIETLKQQCGMVGWIPTDIKVKNLVEPNVYV